MIFINPNFHYLVVQAKSGTGKTLVFVVSALKTVKLEVNFVQILLIAPTREIGEYMSNQICSED